MNDKTHSCIQKHDNFLMHQTGWTNRLNLLKVQVDMQSD